MKNEKPKSLSKSDIATFVKCIDLPGQTVQCWNPKVKRIRIVLRKHRDVIFDIKLFRGMIYTVHSEESDIYCANEKKLYPAGRKISFLDGEVRHFWISREFSGPIVLSVAGSVIATYEPNTQDELRYGSEADVKPKPLMVTMRNFTEKKKGDFKRTDLQNVYRADQVKSIMKRLEEKEYNAREIESAQAMHIVLIDPNKPGMPETIASFIQHGGETLSFSPGDVITRNWIFGQIVGLGAFYTDNRAWVSELWNKSFYIQKVFHSGVPSYYLIFRGDPTRRRIFSATRYAVGDMQVLAFTAGIGSKGRTAVAAAEAVKGAMTKCGLLAVLFTVTIDVAEWLKDYNEFDPVTGKPKRDFSDLLIKIGIDLSKVALNAAITSTILGFFVFAGIITGGVGLVVGSIVIGMAVGYGVDYTDNKLGESSEINKSIRQIGSALESKAPKDYDGYGGEMQSATVFEFGAS
jgi:hypothetical protein